jgi:hypothetical protein
VTSPSSWGREDSCIASTVLPQSRSKGPGAFRGTVIHAYLCAHAKATTDEEREEALLEVDEACRPMAAAIDWNRMPDLSPETGIAELALAWSPSTGKVRELGRGGDLEHDDIAALLKDDEIGGVVDWSALTDDAVVITDWKSGYAALERAEVNRQLMAYAVWVARLLGREKAVVSYARLFENGSVSWDIAEMDAMKLDSAEAALRQHLKRVADAKEAYVAKGVIPTPVEGGHCTYCPAFRFCPAKSALLLSAIQQDPALPAEIARLPQPLDHDVVSRMWPKLKAAAKLIEKLTDDCRSYAKIYGAVKLDSGNVLGEFESQSTSIDPTFARPVLEARFGAQWTNYAIKTEEKLTKDSLDELAQNHSSHGKKAKLLRTVNAELEAAGAIRSVTVRRVTEVSATSKKLKAANADQEQPQLEAKEGTP